MLLTRFAMMCALVFLHAGTLSAATDAKSNPPGKEATKGDVGNKEATKGDVGNKEATKGDVGDKEATKGDVGNKEATKGDVARADAARKKPLQRCDQLSDKAELECLQKARERVVEARRKRVASGKGDEKYVGKDAPKDASAKDPARKAASGK